MEITRYMHQCLFLYITVVVGDMHQKRKGSSKIFCKKVLIKDMEMMKLAKYRASTSSTGVKLAHPSIYV